MHNFFRRNNLKSWFEDIGFLYLGVIGLVTTVALAVWFADLVLI